MNHSLKPSIISALVLAFAGFGDAFLYIALPVNALQMNVPVVWIGFLLSINRFVRLVANQLFAYLFNHFGFKRITILASVFAVLTTFSYGIATGITLWITARILWGFCYSALRIGSISYSLQSKKQGFSLGLNKGLQELGPIIALLVGPLLLQWTNPSTTFFIFALASVSSIIISFYLPELRRIPVVFSFSFNIIPSSFNLLTFLSAFFVQGILIVTITKLFTASYISLFALTTIAGIYLAYRRICTVFISPFGGILADKYGLNKVYLTTLFLTSTGLLLIAIGITEIGVITAFTFNSITAALAPGNVLDGETNHLKAVSTNSTWSDIGAATGALLAGSYILSSHLHLTFFIATFVLLAASIFHIKSSNAKPIELLKWK
jgi:MFS family permease